MEPRYVPLPNPDKEHSPPIRTLSDIASFFSQWSRKWVALAGALLLILIVLLRFPSDSTAESDLHKVLHPPPTPPLLGRDEDVLRLWYPASSSAPEFLLPMSISSYSKIPTAKPRTPLFIGFTRNNDMLVQTVISYLAAGWPAADIIVVDNSGTMDANPLGRLTPSNPFYLAYTTIRARYGVSILQTPTLLSFAQLQNFYLRTAIAYSWPIYFWSHMDVAVLSDETASPYTSFYGRILQILSEHGIHGSDPTTYQISNTWGLRYFTYDWLTLINVQAWRTIGSWDVFIPYYAADCDAYSRVAMNGFELGDVRAGLIYDLASVLPDPEQAFFAYLPDEPLNSDRYQILRAKLEEMMAAKKLGHRNEWQAGKGDGGKGEAWTYHPQGFQKLWWDTAEFGRKIYENKWGTSECRLDEVGLKLEDEFASYKTDD